MLAGKGFYIWKIPLCEGGDPARIAAAAQEAELSHVLIKIADGIYQYNRGLIEALVTALRAVNISPWGWQYTYGQRPEEEASLAAGLVDGLGLDGHVVNAEVEYKTPDAQERAERFMGRLKAKMPQGVPIALSSYRYPSYHPEFPFATFMRGCDMAMPQVYWMQAHNAGAQLRQSVAEYKQFGKPYFPTGAAFMEHGWKATGADVTEFLNTCRELKLTGANFWEWGNSKRYAYDCWQAVDEFAWPVDEIDPQPDPEPTGSLRAVVLVDGLAVRTGPGLTYPLVTGANRLAAGSEVEVFGVDGSEVWVEHGAGRWSAMRRGSTRYMEME